MLCPFMGKRVTIFTQTLRWITLAYALHAVRVGGIRLGNASVS